MTQHVPTLTPETRQLAKVLLCSILGAYCATALQACTISGDGIALGNEANRLLNQRIALKNSSGPDQLTHQDRRELNAVIGRIK